MESAGAATSYPAVGLPTITPSPPASTPSPAAPVASSSNEESYEIKRIDFLGKQVPILMQSKNGPCPLLAIANQLLLSNRLVIPDHQQDISLHALIQMVAERLLDTNPVRSEGAESENTRKAVEDAIETLPTLSRGLDVNVKFGGVNEFEFDRNIAVFDILDVNLYHGWMVDPLDDVFGPLRTLAYNALVERVVMYDAKFGADESALATAFDNPELKKIAVEGELAKTFLNTTASQLTYTGLAKLHEVVKERELCVFFRNNHFSTMFKNNGQLYLLCTDAGFKNRSAVAWERLSDINGDTELCSPSFGDPNAYLSPEDIYAFSSDATSDAMLARQLQMEEEQRAATQQQNAQALQDKDLPVAAPVATWDPKAKRTSAKQQNMGSDDAALARQLQFEEDQLARIHNDANQGKPKSPTSAKGPLSQCVIS